MADSVSKSKSPEKEAEVELTVEDSKSSPSKMETNEALQHLVQGKRHLLVRDVHSAVNSLQEACRLLAEQYGETAKPCGEAYFVYGKALLELSRIETGVLGNALKGVPEGEDADSSRTEDPDKLTEKDQQQVIADVDGALKDNYLWLEKMKSGEPADAGEKSSGGEKPGADSCRDKNTVDPGCDRKSSADDTEEMSTDDAPRDHAVQVSMETNSAERRDQGDVLAADATSERTDVGPVAKEETKNGPAADEGTKETPTAKEETKDGLAAEEGTKDGLEVEEATKDGLTTQEGTKDGLQVKEGTKDGLTAEEGTKDGLEVEEGTRYAQAADGGTKHGPAAEDRAKDELAIEKGMQDSPAAEETKDVPTVQECTKDGPAAAEVMPTDDVAGPNSSAETSPLIDSGSDSAAHSPRPAVGGRDDGSEPPTDGGGGVTSAGISIEQKGVGHDVERLPEALAAATPGRKESTTEETETAGTAENVEDENDDDVENEDEDEDQPVAVSAEGETPSAEGETASTEGDSDTASTGKEADTSQDCEIEEGDADSAKDGDEEDEEDVPNIQLAWEVLELAKVIFSRQTGDKASDLKLSEVYLKLGEVSIEAENYVQAVEDLHNCLCIQKKHLPADDRLIAETHYHLGVAHSLANQYSEAISSLQASVDTIMARVQRLQRQVVDREQGAKVEHEDPFYKEENEIKELEELLPDIKEKMADMREMKLEAQKKVTELLTGGAGPSASGPPISPVKAIMSSRPATSAGSADEQKEVHSIGHLVKRKRVSGEAADESKRARQNGHGAHNGHVDGDKDT